MSDSCPKFRRVAACVLGTTRFGSQDVSRRVAASVDRGAQPERPAKTGGAEIQISGPSVSSCRNLTPWVCGGEQPLHLQQRPLNSDGPDEGPNDSSPPRRSALRDPWIKPPTRLSASLCAHRVGTARSRSFDPLEAAEIKGRAGCDDRFVVGWQAGSRSRASARGHKAIARTSLPAKKKPSSALAHALRFFRLA